MQTFDRAVLETSADFFREVLDDLRECSEEFQKLSAVLDERCVTAEGENVAPRSSDVSTALESVRDTLRSIAKDLLSEELDEGAGGDGAMVPAEGQQLSLGKSQVQTREEAFRALLQVAEFFKRTEPHSPVSYALEQAVRWGRMPLPDLLTELLPEDSARDQLFKLVGIRLPEQPE